MKTGTYPLAVPPELLGDVRRASQALGLSMADIMRQSMMLGLPKLREQLAPDPLKNSEPLSRAESRRCYQQPNREFDALENHLAGLPSPPRTWNESLGHFSWQPPGWPDPHPAVIVAHPDRVAHKPDLTVIVCASRRAARPPKSNEVILDANDGLDWPALCECDLLYTIQKATPVHRRRAQAPNHRDHQPRQRLALGLPRACATKRTTIHSGKRRFQLRGMAHPAQ